MCLILLNMHLFSWTLVLTVIVCTLLYFSVSLWRYMYSKTCWTLVGSFLLMMRIHTWVLFIYGNSLFHGMLFYHWDMYDMLWCSKHCVTMPMGVPLSGKFTLTSNILSLIKGLYDRSFFNVGRVEIFVPSISSEPGDHPLPNLFLCSSNFTYEQ